MEAINDFASSFSDVNTILLIAAIAVSFLLFSWLLKVIRFTLGPLLLIAAIVLVLKFAFGISPNQLWYEVKEIPQMILQVAKEGYRAIVS
jgi:glucan phosphoethanolaminetransferase (alkaline phosphatase superfamily)